jgi:cell fate regulator YaaT (PSP1 superfamily)
MSDEYENLDDEDIANLEDSPVEEEPDFITAAGAGIESIAPDTPIYRLRLFYSHETFLAIYRDGALSPHSMVIVPIRFAKEQAKDMAEVIGPVRGRTSPDSKIVWIERSATAEDLQKARNNRKLEREAFAVCKQRIASYNPDMKLVLVHYLLEDGKILVLFTAENRQDFRELVKDLAGVLKARIEMRQIGIRDEARVVGGLGVCGRLLCCHAVSDKLRPVSIKMAKDQNLSLNSMKISGPCGRLLCCLSYESVFYSEQQRTAPQEGARVSNGDETWTVAEVNLISGQIKIAAADGRTVTLPVNRFERVDNRWRVKG